MASNKRNLNETSIDELPKKIKTSSDENDGKLILVFFYHQYRSRNSKYQPGVNI